MNHVHDQDQTPADVVVRTIGHIRVACLFAALGFATALLLSSMPTAGGSRSNEPRIAETASAADPSRFILNALLVPALDSDAVPLHWVDPRPAMQCGPNTAMRVNRMPLIAGAFVPNQPFELEWLADGCRPFGANGPRFDGLVKLIVFREDWGFSAVVEPAGLRITSAENEPTLMRPRAVSLPQNIDEYELVAPTADALATPNTSGLLGRVSTNISR